MKKSKISKNKNTKSRDDDTRIYVTPGTSGIPDSMRTTLIYKELFSVTAATPVVNLAYRGNGMFDPNTQLGGHQPRYFDQFSALYQKYRVDSSRLTAKVINVSGTSALMYGFAPLTEILTYTTWEDFAELPRVNICPEPVPIAQRYGVELAQKQTTSRVLGVSKIQLEDDDYGAPVTADPVHQWYWNLFLSTMDATNVASFMVEITVEYNAIFYDRIKIGQS